MKNIFQQLDTSYRLWVNFIRVLRLTVLMPSLALTFGVAPQAFADDIEIYRGLTGDDAATSNNTLNPNLLFVLDTSGSMKTPEPVDKSATYDPADDTYGSSSADDYYVYDSSWNYTGVTVNASRNYCKASKDYIADPLNSNRPAFLNKVLIWQNAPAFEEQVDASCSAGPKSFSFSDTSSYTCSGRRCTSRYDYYYQETIDISESYEIELESDEDGYFRADLYEGNALVDSCSWDYRDGGDDYECDLSYDETKTTRPTLRLAYYHTNRSNTYSDLDTKISYTTFCATDKKDAIVNWVNEYDDEYPVTEYRGIECAADSELDPPHGKTDTANNAYPRYQGTDLSKNPRNPKFASSTANDLAVQWDVDTISEKYIVSGHYHDFRQNGIIGDIDPADINTPASGQTALEFCQFDSGFLDYDNVDKYVYNASGEVKRCTSRVQLMKEATHEIFDRISDVNVGLVRYNQASGGTVLTAVDDIGESTNRADLINSLYKLPANGATPLQESMYTAFQYFIGGNVVNNKGPRYNSTGGAREFDPSTTASCLNGSYFSGSELRCRNTEDRFGRETRSEAENTIDNTDPDAVSNGKYISPIQGQCQDNAIVLLSDGDATLDTGHVNAINGLSDSGTACSSSNGDCLDELTRHMANAQDVYAGKVKVTNDDGTVSEIDSGDNKIYTYTIAFGTGISDGSTELEDAAIAGQREGGDSQFFRAADSDQLINRFEQILSDIGSVSNDSFVAPAVAVNAFNRLQFRDDLYFALFQPENSPRWPGNIKKFKIDGSTGLVIDANGDEAINTNGDGFFKDTAVSYWGSNTLKDGPDVLRGGVVDELDLDPSPRQLFADLAGGSSKSISKLGRADFLTKITDAGITDIGQRASPDLATNVDNIIDWSLGYDIPEEVGDDADQPNFYFGESLHSTPFVLDYGTKAATEKDILFVATNQGMLHAIDGATGSEKWAYIPDPDLFGNLGVYYNNLTSDDHQYGLDSELMFDVKRDLSGALTRANVFFGQRRGGTKYFGLDLLNADKSTAGAAAPVNKLWTLDSLPNAGQSWARPVPATVNFCTGGVCTDTEVLFISGGYDTLYDQLEVVGGEDRPKALSALAGNVKGNTIYMVHRTTGALLWMAGKDSSQVTVNSSNTGFFLNSEMTHSFPSEPTVVDADFDGVADFIYAVDIAGRVWRFDFVGDASTKDDSEGNPVITIDENDISTGNAVKADGTNEVNGGIIAELSAESDNRRFFNKVDVSLTPRRDGELARYNLITGSGNRSDPTLDEVAENRLYFLFDRNVVFPQFTFNSEGNPSGVTYNLISESERIDSTDIKSRFIETDLDLADDHKYGFYIPLSTTGTEKMLNGTLTNNGVVIAVSYSPTVIKELREGVFCQKGAGSSSLYQIDLGTGETSRLTLDKAGISARPVVIEVENPDAATDPDAPDTKKILIIGTESFDASGAPVITEDPDSDVEDLEDPGLGESDVGQIKKINWWERTKR